MCYAFSDRMNAELGRFHVHESQAVQHIDSTSNTQSDHTLDIKSELDTDHDMDFTPESQQESSIGHGTESQASHKSENVSDSQGDDLVSEKILKRPAEDALEQEVIKVARTTPTGSQFEAGRYNDDQSRDSRSETAVDSPRSNVLPNALSTDQKAAPWPMLADCMRKLDASKRRNEHLKRQLSEVKAEKQAVEHDMADLLPDVDIPEGAGKGEIRKRIKAEFDKKMLNFKRKCKENEEDQLEKSSIKLTKVRNAGKKKLEEAKSKADEERQELKNEILELKSYIKNVKSEHRESEKQLKDEHKESERMLKAKQDEAIKALKPEHSEAVKAKDRELKDKQAEIERLNTKFDKMETQYKKCEPTINRLDAEKTQLKKELTFEQSTSWNLKQVLKTRGADVARLLLEREDVRKEHEAQLAQEQEKFQIELEKAQKFNVRLVQHQRINIMLRNANDRKHRENEALEAENATLRMQQARSVQPVRALSKSDSVPK